MDVRFFSSFTCLLTITLCRGDVPSCSSDFPNGQVPSWCTSTTGSVCPYYCNVAYKAHETIHQLLCTIKGTWEPYTAFGNISKVCSEIYCPGVIPDGYILANCDRKFGSHCGYQCNNRYDKTNPTDDEHSLKCVGLGEWEHHRREKILCTDEKINIVMAAGIAGGLLLLALTITVPLVQRHMQRSALRRRLIQQKSDDRDEDTGIEADGIGHHPANFSSP